MKRIYILIALLSMVGYGINAQNRVVRVMQNGGVVNSFSIEQIDSIIIDEIIDTPSNLTATISGRSMTLRWTEIADATYDIYRSASNATYSVLAAGVTGNSYVDNSPMAGINYYKIKAKANGIESEFSDPAIATLPSSELESGIYLGITGFNQALYNYPIIQLDDSSIAGFNGFVDGLTMKNGTLLYYSVDQAINEMQSTELPADITSAAIVTFTDGLDQGSMMMGIPYDDDMSYLDALNKRILSETVAGKPITAYSIGIRGQDVADEAMFTNNLKKLSSEGKDNKKYVYEVTNMSSVNAAFIEIAEQLSQSNYVQTINLKIPGMSNGTLIRFTFDNVNSAEKSTLYIEGTFNLSTRSLENVQYEGLTSTSGTIVNGVVDGIFVSFTFEGVHTDKNKLIDSKFTDEWTYRASNNTWQINSEFSKTENSDIITERSSAVIMLVLDCSISLAGDFTTAQANAKDFINTLYGAVGGDSGSGENLGGIDNDNTIYSTTPKDLTLAIWKDGTRYYLTKEEYDKANLSGAIIEGLTIVSGGKSFILSLRDVQTNSIGNISTAKILYGDIMPTADQGKIISAKWSDINSSISKFGGVQLSPSTHYYTFSTSSANYNYTNCIYGSGGNLYGTNFYPYVRGVKSTNNDSAIYWTDPDDLKLSVLISGNREFLDKQEYDKRKDKIDTIEGVIIIAGGEKFVLRLNNEQTDRISSITTAMNLYGSVMPTANQGKIISAKWSDINSSISKFGGVQLSPSTYYYTSSTSSATNYNYTNCIYGSGGNLYDTNNIPYVRGVTNFE